MNHRRWLLTIGLLLMAFVLSAFISEANEKIGKTEIETLKKHDFEFNEKTARFIQLPDSNYTLAIMYDPNRIAVLSKREGLLKRNGYVFETVFNVYEEQNKEALSTYSYNNLLKFGFIGGKENQVVVMNGKRIPSISVSEYFQDNKFAYLYKDLRFWYLKKPVNNTNQPIWVE